MTTCEKAGLTGLKLRLCETREDYRRRFLGFTQPQHHKTFRVPIHVAEVRLQTCQACEHWKPCHVCGAGQVKACKHPEQKARIHEKLIDLAAMKCPAGKWQTPGTVRHLCYHIYPVAGNGTWEWNVAQLCGRLACFNGKRIVAIVTDPPTGRKPDPDGPHSPDRGRQIRGCDSAAQVKAEFASHGATGIEFIELENDPSLREVVSLLPMLERLPQDPESVTLYAQAKGVTRGRRHIARRWTEALYEIMLDYWPLAVEQLQGFPVTGCFKKLGPGWHPSQSKSDWHYSGSWFWFRNADLFARDWRKVDQFWSGIEPYPSQQFFAKEAACMFHTAQVPSMNLYSHQYWHTRVFSDFNEWRKLNEAKRTTLWPR